MSLAKPYWSEYHQSITSLCLYGGYDSSLGLSHSALFLNLNGLFSSLCDVDFNNEVDVKQ